MGILLEEVGCRWLGFAMHHACNDVGGKRRVLLSDLPEMLVKVSFGGALTTALSSVSKLSMPR